MINTLFNNKKYEPLRDMESFTQDMFNRIIDFQEKQHPAWKPALPFEQRIKGLPLHYLIFSCADRDPEQFGPTVSHYYPLREEMIKIAHYVKQLSSNPVLCDYYPGNGFIGSLIAREGIDTVGLRRHIGLPNQISEFYDANAYHYSDNEYTDEPFNAVFVSWPPAGINPTPAILTRQPGIIIYVYTEHTNQETGQRQTGSDDMFDALTEPYELVDHWSVTRPKDILHEIWPDMTPNIEEYRQVRIYAHKDIPPIAPFDPSSLDTDFTPYDWEADLHMAQLALEAKRELEMRQMMM